jgi:hypothetical protein
VDDLARLRPDPRALSREASTLETALVSSHVGARATQARDATRLANAVASAHEHARQAVAQAQRQAADEAALATAMASSRAADVVELVRAQAREAVAQPLIEHSEGMQAAERQRARQLKQAEEARRSMTEQLAAAAAEAALVTALQNRHWSSRTRAPSWAP